MYSAPRKPRIAESGIGAESGHTTELSILQMNAASIPVKVT